MVDEKGRQRVVLERLEPRVDGGRFAVKRTVGEPVEVSLQAFADGHDAVAADLRIRAPDGTERRVALDRTPPDTFRGVFTPDAIGRWTYGAEAWLDRYGTWRRDTLKKAQAGLDISVELVDGAALLGDATQRATGAARARLEEAIARLSSDAATLEATLDEEVSRLVRQFGARHFVAAWPIELPLVVDPERARFTAWYELFPRSTSPDEGRSGTLADVTARLDYVAGMGFDTLYLPPIHPIGRTHRKGRNNRREAEPGDVGSPWAIGAAEGGHTALHPDLGSLADFDRLVAAARERSLEIALDIAFQCAPDHPWVREHPQWFRHRSDGTIQYAENPPKKYEDIYPIDFESEDWESLWRALRDVFTFWAERGVRTFRVDNPHTKPFPFWEWVISEVKAKYPETVFLSEAFTRPNVAYRLAKLGFTQSYNYFPWKNTKWEIEQYYAEITKAPVADFYRPSSWTNTPDILTEHLQHGGRPAAITRAVLASTLSASYGVYGPVFELVVNQAREPGSEEYLDSEKYQVRHWSLDQSHSLAPLLQRLNRIRRSHPALQHDRTLEFHPTTDDCVLAYSKTHGTERIVVIANVDPHGSHEAEIDLAFLEGVGPIQAHDLLSEERFVWSQRKLRMLLHPGSQSARVFHLRLRKRTEADFDYY
jgi:starch synthase (maltosyl-transferring)